MQSNWRSRDKRRRRSRSSSKDRHSKRSRSPRDSRDRWRRDESPSGYSRRLPGPERRDVMPFVPRRSPPRNAKIDMSSDERDERTIFILQLARQTRPRDLEEFFSSVGHVRDVRVITDTKTRRSKGIAYVEFWEKESVPLALGLNGQKIHGAPLVIQMTYSERNRAAAAPHKPLIGLGLTTGAGPLKLQVSNLHPNITDDMLNDIFEPFGRVIDVQVIRDSTGSSRGIAIVLFRHTDEGKRALEQLNGFELAGRALRILALDEDDENHHGGGAEGSGPPKPTYAGYGGDQSAPVATAPKQQVPQHQQQFIPIPVSAPPAPVTAKAIAPSGGSVVIPTGIPQTMTPQAPVLQSEAIPSIATQCFMLSNMFDREQETESGWDLDVRDDVIEECNVHGGTAHVYVDKMSSEGNVYVKCPNVQIAYKSVQALHGRWFAGKVITANYVPVSSYHQLFPDAAYTQNLIQPRPRQ